ncbi:carbohydrate ABC transporter permease, partial [Paenibacillus kobensis]|uniref:carbohydrate ABC transporter permease n=1 Tax=Paenibacillus kobensis TaxID=59841 RepID=UPI0013E3524E
MNTTKKRFAMEPAIFNTINYFLLLCILVVTLYPFLNTIAVSFNEGIDTTRGGIYLLPREFTWKNYDSVFSSGHLPKAFWISIARTVSGTVLSVFFTSMLAYVLSRPEYMFKKSVTIIVVLTMYFSAGLIPSYFLIKDLHMLNTFWVYIIPGMISAFNLIVVRTYIHTLPESLVESAKIDGAGEFRTFMSIILPLCMPVLATVSLFVAVGQWNSWFDTFIFAPKQSLSTLQYELMKLLNNSMSAGASSNAASAGVSQGGQNSAA